MIASCDVCPVLAAPPEEAKPIRLGIFTSDRADKASTEALLRAARLRPSDFRAFRIEHDSPIYADGAPPYVGVLVGDRIELLDGLKRFLRAGAQIVFVGAGEYTRGARWDNAVRLACEAAVDMVFSYAPHEDHEDWAWSGVPGLDEIVPLGRRAEHDGTILVAVNPVTAALDEEARIWDALVAVEARMRWRFAASRPGGDAQYVPPVLRGGGLPVLGGPFQLALGRARVIVGNSSAGIFEAPLYGVPTVDIGTRQLGRAELPSVFRAEPNPQSISDALRRACAYLGPWETPYRNPAPGGACKVILDGALRLARA